MIKTVPQIIKKEKGQFLQTFISTFVTSTVSPPPRPGRLEGEEDSLEDLANLGSIFGDNFELGGANSLPPATLGPSHTCSVIGGDHQLQYSCNIHLLLSYSCLLCKRLVRCPDVSGIETFQVDRALAQNYRRYLL